MGNTPTKAEMLLRRDDLLKRLQLRLLRVFDTIDKEGGKKDVTLVQKNTERFILRIGEVRPSFFFPDGYRGEHLLIPRLVEHESGELPFELEEYIPGEHLWQHVSPGEGDGKLSDESWWLILAVFWEFQSIGKTLPLTAKYSIEKVKKHFETGRTFMRNDEEVERLIDRHEAFWSGNFPSKWKFALDNLLLTPSGKVAFIDNAKVGHRFFGYDIGWIIWPLWLHMREEAYEQATEEYMASLASVAEKMLLTKPKSLIVNTDIEQAFWLTIFERLVGAHFDLVHQTKHLASSGLVEHSRRWEAHRRFLGRLLDAVVVKLH